MSRVSAVLRLSGTVGTSHAPIIGPVIRITIYRLYFLQISIGLEP